MYLKEILNEAKERSHQSSSISSHGRLGDVSETSEAKKKITLERIKGLTWHTGHGWAGQGTTTTCGPCTWVWVRGKRPRAEEIT